MVLFLLFGVALEKCVLVILFNTASPIELVWNNGMLSSTHRPH